jgi:uncharacterized protein (DUF58 family)
LIYPTTRVVLFLLLPAAGSIFVLVDHYVFKSGLKPWQSFALLGGLAGFVVLASLLDALFLPRRRRLKANRGADQVFSLNFPHAVEISVTLKKGLLNSYRCELIDDSNNFFQARPEVWKFKLKPGLNNIKYRLRIRKRGLYELEGVYLTCYALLGLVSRIYFLPCKTSIRVYPDLKAINEYVLLARQSHQGLLGIRRIQRAGGDTEFESLREYQPDDEFRHIDWKASARNSRLIVRTYQMNKNQTVIFMVDCGRMLAAEYRGRSLLDYVQNSVLLLARVALEQGDNVGLIAFAGKVLRYVKPGQSVMHHRRLTQALYDIYPLHEESNLDLAFHYLHQVCRKRSLVMLLTNVIDQMNAEMITSYMKSIGRRHLPFSVLLRMPEVEAITGAAPQSLSEFYYQAAAADFLTWRQSVLEKLKGKGALAVELQPDQMNMAMINQYLWLKARKLL